MNLTIKNIIDNELIEIHYQLIVSPNKDIAAGVEALVRATDPSSGDIIYPADLFKAAHAEKIVLEFEMAIVSAAIKSFKPLYTKHNEMLLFINVGEDIIKHCKHSPYILDEAKKFNINTSNIVFDLNDIGYDSLGEVKSFVDYHQSHGFFVCLDNVGSDYFNIDKVLYLDPDIIKIDTIRIREMQNVKYKEHLLKYIKYISNDLGILIVAKSIENEEDLEAAFENNVQFMQGYYVANPMHSNDDTIINKKDTFLEFISKHNSDENNELEATRKMMSKAINIIKDININLDGLSINELHQSIDQVFEKHPYIENLWILDENGKQIGPTLINHDQYHVKSSSIFQIYNEGSDFSNKEVYNRLSSFLIDVWVTKPYKSILTNNICIGTSTYTKIGGDTNILCANLNYQTLAINT